jgi:hypothetical protein
MKRSILIFTTSFAISLVVSYLLLTLIASYPITSLEDIYLPFGCELWYMDTITQPINTLVLACPGVDLIRLWPLPIIRPW